MNANDPPGRQLEGSGGRAGDHGSWDHQQLQPGQRQRQPRGQQQPHSPRQLQPDSPGDLAKHADLGQVRGMGPAQPSPGKLARGAPSRRTDVTGLPCLTDHSEDQVSVGDRDPHHVSLMTATATAHHGTSSRASSGTTTGTAARGSRHRCALALATSAAWSSVT